MTCRRSTFGTSYATFGQQYHAMDQCFIVTLLLLCVAPPFSVSAEDDATAANLLLKSLMKNYDNRLLPTRHSNERIDVHLKFILGRIESLDEKRQILISFGWLVAAWTDNLLQWDPEQHDGTSRLVLPANTVWLPEIAMTNSIDHGNDLTFGSKFRVSVFPDGSVMWAPGMKWQTACRVDLKYFPFDHQTCNISFTYWIYSLKEVDFILNSTEIDIPDVSLNLYHQNAEWTLVSTYVSKDYLTADDDNFQPHVHLTINLARKPQYFVFNILIPSIIITVLSVLVYCLPCESGEKSSLAVTILLSYTVLLLIVSDVSPRNGDSVPLLTLYLLFGMVVTGLSLLGAVWVLSIHHEPPHHRVPRWLRAIFLYCLPRCFCMHRHEKSNVNSVFRGTQGKALYSAEGRFHNDLSAQYLHMRVQNMTEEARSDAIRSEWRCYARSLDRCHFLIVATLIACATVALLTALLAFAPNSNS